MSNLRRKNIFFEFREYVSRTLLQGLQSQTNVSLIFKRFLKTLLSAWLSLIIFPSALAMVKISKASGVDESGTLHSKIIRIPERLYELSL